MKCEALEERGVEAFLYSKRLQYFNALSNDLQFIGKVIMDLQVSCIIYGICGILSNMSIVSPCICVCIFALIMG